MADAPRHPCKWNRSALDHAAVVLAEHFGEAGASVLDPFAGIGRVHDLRARGWWTVGGELESEWATAVNGTIVADALRFPAPDAAFDAVVTSPVFGNRCSDHHDARDACKPCGGAGCAACEMSGLSRRNTYRHALGRMPTSGSSAVMQFGPDYRRFHRDWLLEAQRLLRPDGLLVINMGNHWRAGREVDVIGWWLGCLYGDGWRIRSVDRIAAPKLRHGANRDLRVDGEVNIVAQVRP